MSTQSEECRICGAAAPLAFQAKVLQKHLVGYYRCPKCGFVQTQNPFWLREAYRRSINVSDTGLVSRNVLLSKKASVILYFLIGGQLRYLDYAGGYGLFTRLMRDVGFDFYWDDAFTENLFACGFAGKDRGTKFDAITAFEVFEHFALPAEEVRKLCIISKNILFSTLLIDPDSAPPLDWWYYSYEHGQHVAFYSLKTLGYLARINNLNLYSDQEGFHMFSEKKVSQGLFRLLAASSTRGLFAYVRRRMKSRTSEDSSRLLSIS